MSVCGYFDVANVRVWLCAFFFSSFFFQCVCMFHFLNLSFFFLLFVDVPAVQSWRTKGITERKKKESNKIQSLVCVFARQMVKFFFFPLSNWPPLLQPPYISQLFQLLIRLRSCSLQFPPLRVCSLLFEHFPQNKKKRKKKKKTLSRKNSSLTHPSLYL